MESFLAALTPSVREELLRAIEETPNGQQRLRELASNYFDSNGDWPTDPRTADWVARTFIHRAETYYGVGLKSTYSAAGVASTVLASMAAAGITVGAAKGAVILGSGLVETYSSSTLGYAMGLNTETLPAFIGIYNRIAETQDWKRLGFAAKDPNIFTQRFREATGKALEQEIRSGLTGLFSHYAWRGVRSALAHTGVNVAGDRTQEVGWVENFVSRFINYQIDNSVQAANHVVQDSQRQGYPPEMTGARLKQTFGLSPRYAQAVDNYRRGLLGQGVPRGRAEALTQDYANRLMRSRAKTVVETEGMTLFNLGRDRHWQEAVNRGEMPLDTVKMWVTAKDELVCKVCRPMDGQWVALGESFVSRNGNIIVPSVHPNCRCLIIPVRNVADFSGSEFIFPVSQKVTKHMGGVSGKKYHPSGTPQIIHAGYDKAISELKEGAYDMPMSWMLGHIRGSGIRIGQNNRIRGLANSILENGFTKPITMWVYEDGPFVRDGMHRLEAAHLIGMRRVPVAIHHVKGNRPQTDLRGRYHGWRIRRKGELPRRDTPFRDVKQEDGFIRWFNERMADRGEVIARNPNAKPKKKTKWNSFGKAEEGPVRFEEMAHV